MSLIIGTDQMFQTDLGIALRGGQPPVPQQFLHAAQIRARGQQMGGKGMAQTVRGNRKGQTGPAAEPGNNPYRFTPVQAPTKSACSSGNAR